ASQLVPGERVAFTMTGLDGAHNHDDRSSMGMPKILTIGGGVVVLGVLVVILLVKPSKSKSKTT
ncbi:MAG: hypothetical protein ACYTFO_10550, partial [Planctomycetota bacterium]